MLEEREDGPGNGGEDSGAADQEQQQPHLLQGDRVVPCVALGEQRMGIGIVPYRPRSVKILAPNREVTDLDDAVREEEQSNRVGREIVHVGALDYQIHRAQAELQQQHEQVHLEKDRVRGRRSRASSSRLLLNRE